jgi:two-component system OmpR family response regulator
LYARLRSLTRRSVTPRPTRVEVDDLVLDPAAHSVTRGGVDIALSPKEFAVLELLMRRPNETLSRTDILEHGWDFAYDGTSNVVDVYVRYLREKVDRPFGRETIETVRGVGYRLRAS